MSRSLASLVIVTFVVAACSSSSSSPTGNGTGSGSGSGAGDGGGSPSSCSCNITFNGTPGTVNCGQTACVGGEQFACASDGSGTTDKGACPMATKDAGSGGQQCIAKGGNCGTPDNCCNGTFCGSGDRCSVDYGGACGAPSDCEPASPPVSPGGDCQNNKCCELKGYPCQTAGPDAACCSGTCGAPNGSGISFCN